jgi:hypothetical protein
MKKQLFLVIILLITYSCKKNENEIIEYDKDGKIISKSYINNESGQTDSIIYYKSNMITKSFFDKKNRKSFYFKSYGYDGKMIAEGNTFNMIKIGKWKFYDSDNKIKKIVEYKNICGKEYPNQLWNYDDLKLNINKSTYFNYRLKNSKFESNKTNELIIEYVPYFKKWSQSVLFSSIDFNNTFCNIDKIKSEVVFPSNDKNIIFKVNLKFSSKGKNHFRGYISEKTYKTSSNMKIENYSEKITYIDIPIILN